ncbi:ubiquitin-conjugating enzyme e2 19 [Quercus suber]|uniref:Ubiquitin-conjugating enzyme e2 19 n=1 Tax=Quercus suber TaxID=58331 RepID=A0AAW0KXE4_QUESU
MATITGYTETAQGYQDNTNVAVAAAPKHPNPPAKTVDTQSVLKRLQSELMALMMSGESGISAFPEEDNIFCWKGTIAGSKDTVFEGTEYKMSLSFSNDYPFKPRRSSLKPAASIPMWMCMEIFAWTFFRYFLFQIFLAGLDKWSSAYDVRTILLSIQSLLGEPNISSPLNTQAAQLWSNQEEYRKMVEKLYKPPTAA